MMKYNLKVFSAVLFTAAVVTVLFQNCQKADFSQAGSSKTNTANCASGQVATASGCLPEEQVTPIVEFSKVPNFATANTNFGMATDSLYIRVRFARENVLGCVEATLAGQALNNRCQLSANWGEIESIAVVSANEEWRWNGPGSYIYTFDGPLAENRLLFHQTNPANGKKHYLTPANYTWFFKNGTNGAIGSGSIVIQ